MCARLLACPLCSQPGFLTVDALRAGLVSVATRPLICPVCNEVLLGIDKLTIHLFGHTINLENNTAESSAKRVDIVVPNEHFIAIHNAHSTSLAVQDWNTSEPQQLDKVQTSNTIESGANDGICAKSSEPDVSIAENKIQCMVNAQSQAQNHNLFMKNANQHNFISDYDLIKINILPQSSDNHDAASKSTANVQQGISKVVGVTQHFCNDSIKRSNVSEETTQAEKTITSNLLAAIKMAGVADTNMYQNIERECAESNNNQRVTRETLIALSDKESEFTNFQERCSICGFHFSDANILALHMQLVHEQDSVSTSNKILKNFSCHLCSKVFKMRGSLMVHMRVAHVGRNLGSLSKDGQTEFACSDATGYNCPTCGKRFKKEQHVVQHLKIHEGKQWECEICSKMFTTKYFLKKHKRLHSGEMPYKCKICDKSFTFQQSYHKHRLYHKDDKPHTCSTCGRSFKELSTLHNHERIHTGEKPFACETCGKCFRQRVSYLVHRRIHTGVMPYKCTMCGKSFRYKVSQRTHKCPVQASGSIQHSCNDAIGTQRIDNERIRLQASDTVQNGQSCTTVVSTNEREKFVLMINNDGRHVLALQSEIDNLSLKEKQQNVDYEDSKTENTKRWDESGNLDSIEYEESAVDAEVEKVHSNNEKLNIKSTNDFFSMVISPFDNSVSSPTFEMEHLRVSSPKRREDPCTADFPQASDNTEMNIVKSTVEQNFRHDKDVNDPLQTINEESLKELLYGMNRK